MISIEPTRPDAAGTQGPDTKQIAPGVTYSPATGEVVVSDGEQTLSIRISQKK